MGPVGTRSALSFRETLQRHLEAIQNRDLDALADTVAEGAIVLIMADGKLVRSAREFLDAHRAWFAMQGWQAFFTPTEISEGTDLAFAAFHLLYVDGALRQQSHLTLVFARREGRWLMVLDQNTPIK